MYFCGWNILYIINNFVICFNRVVESCLIVFYLYIRFGSGLIISILIYNFCRLVNLVKILLGRNFIEFDDKILRK